MKAGRRSPSISRAPRGFEASVADAGFEVVVFTVGPLRFAAARGDVGALRPSPRLRSVLGGTPAMQGLPLVSMSSILGLDRDSSVDRRVIEVMHWGERLGLEVTAILGIHRVELERLWPLPELVARSLSSRNVLGLAVLEGGTAVLLDLAGLLVERGVEIP